MQSTKNQKSYFFVDESGDTTFYDKKGNFIVGKEGCSKILIVGFVKTKKPELIRSTLEELRKELCSDPSLQCIPSIKKTARAFHAKDDCEEVRQAVFNTIKNLDFTAQIVVGRKTKSVFRKFNGHVESFYDYLVTQLFRNVLHKSSENIIYFAIRGNRKRQEPLTQAINKAKKLFERKWGTKVNTEVKVLAQTPSGEPCLQVIDYVNWAVQRAYNKQDMSYFNIIKDKVRLIVDLYDYKPGWGNFYNSRNPFDINKISPL